MTTDTTASKPTRKPTAAQAGKAAEAAAEARKAHNAGKRRQLRKLIRSMSQGDWLAICRGLDLARDQIAEDDNLTLLAALYVAEKRQHGAASLEVLLELTDRDLLERHGFQLEPLEDDVDEAEDAGAED